MPKPEDKMEKGTSGAAAYVGVVRAMLGLTDHVICGSGDIKAIVQWLAREDEELPKRCKEWQKNVDAEKLNNVERSAPSFYAIYEEQLTEDVGNAYALLDAGVSDVTVLIDKAPKGKPDKAMGLPGEQDYSPTRDFGGCVLISRRRVAMPEGLPEEWTKAGGRCTLLRGRDGPDRGASCLHAQSSLHPTAWLLRPRMPAVTQCWWSRCRHPSCRRSTSFTRWAWPTASSAPPLRSSRRASLSRTRCRSPAPSAQ